MYKYYEVRVYVYNYDSYHVYMHADSFTIKYNDLSRACLPIDRLIHFARDGKRLV